MIKDALSCLQADGALRQQPVTIKATSRNEVSRSLGQEDIYAFYLAPAVRNKLLLIRQLILHHVQN